MKTSYIGNLAMVVIGAVLGLSAQHDASAQPTPKAFPTPEPAVYAVRECVQGLDGTRRCTETRADGRKWVWVERAGTITFLEEPQSCDLGKLVRAARAYRDGIPVSWAEPGMVSVADGRGDLTKNGKLLRALDVELDRCEPRKGRAEKEGGE